MAIKWHRVQQDEVLAYVDILMASGKLQISLLFDWTTGEWIVSTPTEESEDEDEEMDSAGQGDDD